MEQGGCLLRREEGRWRLSPSYRLIDNNGIFIFIFIFKKGWVQGVMKNGGSRGQLVVQRSASALFRPSLPANFPTHAAFVPYHALYHAAHMPVA